MDILYDGMVACKLCGKRFSSQCREHNYSGIICDECISEVLPRVDEIYNLYSKRGVYFSRWDKLRLNELQKLAYDRLQSDRRLEGMEVASSLRRLNLLTLK